LLKHEADLCAKAGEVGVTVMKNHVVDHNLAFLDGFKPVDASYQSALARNRWDHR